MKKDNIFNELYKSYKECSKNKGNTINALNFTIEKEKNLLQLKKDILEKVYTPGKSIYFVVTKPKPREVFAADFRDRVVHHFFVRSIEKNFYTSLTTSAYSCIKGRGTHKCIQDIKSVYKNYKYYLQVDIRSFFMSIDKNILKHEIKKYLPKTIKEHINDYLELDYDLGVYTYLLEEILNHNPIDNCIYKGEKKLKKLIIAEKSLFSLENGKGMAIGNYSSQFFANIYLNELDKYIIDLGYTDYFRYVDDLVILGNDYNELKKLEILIDNYLQNNLQQSLAKQKTNLKSTNAGLDFLGYFIKPHTTYTRKRVIKNLLEKIHILKKELVCYWKSYDVKIIYFFKGKKLLQVCASYFGHFLHSDSKHLLKKILYKNNFLQYFFDFDARVKQVLKLKKFKNKNLAYNYYDIIYKNTILLFPINNYFVFKKKYMYLLQNNKNIVYNKNTGFKIAKDYYKLFCIDILKHTNKNILIVNYHLQKYSLKTLIIRKNY